MLMVRRRTARCWNHLTALSRSTTYASATTSDQSITSGGDVLLMMIVRWR